MQINSNCVLLLNITVPHTNTLLILKGTLHLNLQQCYILLTNMTFVCTP